MIIYGQIVRFMSYVFTQVKNVNLVYKETSYIKKKLKCFYAVRCRVYKARNKTTSQSS